MSFGTLQRTLAGVCPGRAAERGPLGDTRNAVQLRSSIRARSPVPWLLALAVLGACARGEDHHVAVWDADGRRIAAAFAAELSADYSCDDLLGNTVHVSTSSVPDVPAKLFCRNAEFDVTVHATLEPDSAKIDVYSRSRLGYQPGYDLIQRLAGSFRLVAGESHVSLRLGPD